MIDIFSAMVVMIIMALWGYVVGYTRSNEQNRMRMPLEDLEGLSEPYTTSEQNENEHES